MAFGSARCAASASGKLPPTVAGGPWISAPCLVPTPCDAPTCSAVVASPPSKAGLNSAVVGQRRPGAGGDEDVGGIAP